MDRRPARVFTKVLTAVSTVVGPGIGRRALQSFADGARTLPADAAAVV